MCDKATSFSISSRNDAWLRPSEPDISQSRIADLEEKLNLILVKIKKLEKLEKLDNIEVGVNKMSKHIDFAVNAYDKIQTPLVWLCTKVNNLRGNRDEIHSDHLGRKADNYGHVLEDINGQD